MELRKSQWSADGNRISLTVPFAKVDKERRLVSGFATLDNIDQGDDVVLASASKVAFERFKGNIREMHEPIAAGRLVDFKEDSYYDSETNKFYNGIYVTVYVSKGAPSTWEKVLDGTLSGFSIGGNINDAETQFVKDAGDNGKPIRFIKDYDLAELSLVDNPCNQFANVFSIQKSQGVSFMKGMAVETHIVNVFWCPNDEIAKNSSNESEDCLACGSGMVQIGWYEKGEDEVAKVQNIVTGFLRQKEDDAVTKQHNATGEGGVEMAENENVEETPAEDVVTSEDVAVEEAPAEETAAVEEVATEEASEEKAVETEEVASEPDFEKMFDDLKGSVNETLEKNQETIAKAVETVEAKVHEVTKAFDEKAAEFEKTIGEIREGLSSVKDERSEVTKRLDALEKATAIKKSGDVETQAPEKKLQKGLWSGTFFESE